MEKSNFVVIDGAVDFNKIPFIKIDYKDVFLSTLEEQVYGYTKLKVITYSYGLDYIEEIVTNGIFKEIDILIGAERMLNAEVKKLKTVAKLVAEGFSFEKTIINQKAEFIKNKGLFSLVENGNLKFYTPRDGYVDHEKLYLLSNDDDTKHKVILGSANFSRTAFSGDQGEILMVTEDKKCYDRFNTYFDNFIQNEATIDISKKAKIESYDVNELPSVNKAIKTKEVIVIQEEKNPKKAAFVAALTQNYEVFSKITKDVKSKSSGNGSHIIKYENIIKLVKNSEKMKVEIESEFRKKNEFIIDFENDTVKFNDIQYNVKPDLELVKKNLLLLNDYLIFDYFTKDVNKIRAAVIRILNYLFISPFIEKFLYIANKRSSGERFFPAYLLIYGDSDGGKTKIVKTAYKLMFDFNENFTCDPSHLTKSKIYKNIRTRDIGIPQLIDDVTGGRIIKMKEFVKNETSEIKKDVNGELCPVIITSNDNVILDPSLTKRMVSIRVDNRVIRKYANKQETFVNRIISNMTTDLYKYILYKAFPKIKEKYYCFLDDDMEMDIFVETANALKEIYIECGMKYPEVLDDISLGTYINSLDEYEHAKHLLLSDYNTSPDIFKFDKNKNEIKIDYSGRGQEDAYQTIEILKKELPAELEIEARGRIIVLKYDETIKFLDMIQEKSGLWDIFINAIKGKK